VPAGLALQPIGPSPCGATTSCECRRAVAYGNGHQPWLHTRAYGNTRPPRTAQPPLAGCTAVGGMVCLSLITAAAIPVARASDSLTGALHTPIALLHSKFWVQ